MRTSSGLSSAQGSEPSPPASATATTISMPLAPAIGAWMIGTSMPNRSVKRECTAPVCAGRL